MACTRPAGVTSVFHDRFVIGTRSDSDLVLYDQDVSPSHALITPEETGWQVEDIGSLRGVRVNGRVRATARLQKGDRVSLGSTTLVMVSRRSLASGTVHRFLAELLEHQLIAVGIQAVEDSRPRHVLGFERDR